MNRIADIKPMAPYIGREDLEVEDHNTNDIIKTIKKYHKVHAGSYDKMSKQFWHGNVEDTARGLFDFLKKNVRYDVEPEDYQTVKSPGAILHQAHGDCKHYASFITGIVDSLQRAGYPIKSKYRFVSDTRDRDVHHVFAVVSGEGREYWVDPVLSRFDERPTFYNVKDANMSSIGAVYHISGIGDATALEKALPTPGHVTDFLKQHGLTPADFISPAHMTHFLMSKLFHHKHHGHHGKHHGHEHHPHHMTEMQRMMYEREHGGMRHHGHHKGGMRKHRDGANMSGIGRKKHHHKNFLKAIAHGFEVNAHNFGKEIKKDADKVKHLVLKVSLSAARGPFLSIVDLNAFNLAHRLHDTLAGPHRQHLLDKWNDMGGKPQALINAVNNGYRQYKKHHGGYDTSMKIHGTGVGVVQVAALLALASGIIAAIKKFLPASPQDDKEMAEAGHHGTKHLVDKANQGMEDATGEGGGGAAAADALNQVTQPGSANGSMAITTGVDSQGNPQLTVHDVDHPDIPDGGSPDPDPGNVAAITDPTKTTDMESHIKDIFHKMGDFVKDNKLAVGLAVAGVVVFKNRKIRRKLGF